MMTRLMVRKMRRVMLKREEAGLTRVAMEGRMGVFKVEVVREEMYRSVRTYWLTNEGRMLPSGPSAKETPLSMPSPSNQWASRPRFSFVTGLPPLRTYSPPKSSFGRVPVYEHGVKGSVL